jgi:hypothetical protein
MLQDGKFYFFECLGSTSGDRWLDGITSTQSVHLRPDVTDSYPGTRWKAVLYDRDKNIWQFVCWPGGDNTQYLNGLTKEGRVNLTNHPEATGTRWALTEIDDQHYTIECMGDGPGNKWLNGETSDGGVDLQPDPSGPHSGTMWTIFTLPT